MSIPPAAPYAEFVAHLNLTTPPADSALEAEVQLHLAAATGAAEGVIGPIVHREVTGVLTARGGSGLLPAPVAEVESLTGTTTYTGDDVTLDGEAGIVSGLRDGRYVAVYTAGRAATEDDVPEDIRLAVCIIGKHLWETQRGRGTTARGGVLADTVPPDERVPSGFLIPHRARSLLGDYEPLPVA